MARLRATAAKPVSELSSPLQTALQPRLPSGPTEDSSSGADDNLPELDAHALLDLTHTSEGQMRAAFPGSLGRAGRLTLMLQAFVIDVKSVDAAAWPQMLRVLENLAKPPRLALPKSAPQAWADRDLTAKVSPVAFARQVYKAWLGRGLTRQHLNKIDPSLYRAISVWETRHPDDRLTEVPTLSETIDQRIASLAGEFSEEELRRLGSTLQTRQRRTKKKVA